MRDRHEKIERAHPGGREGRIGHGRVLNVKRRILREDVAVFDLIQISRVLAAMWML